MINSIITSEKGFIHTIEAAIAVVILVSFVITAFPLPGPQVVGSEALKLRVFDALSDLDERGLLAGYASTRNTSGLEDALRDYIASGYSYAAAISYFEKHNGTYEAGNNSSFQVSNIDGIISASLKISGNISSPIVYLSPGCVQPVWGYNGNLSEHMISDGIVDCLVEGSNSIIVNTVDNASVSWVIRLKRFQEGSAPPSDESIRAVSYLLSTWNESLEPVEVKSYAW